MSGRDLTDIGNSHVDTSTRVHDLNYMALLGDGSVLDQGKNDTVGKPTEYLQRVLLRLVHC